LSAGVYFAQRGIGSEQCTNRRNTASEGGARIVSIPFSRRLAALCSVDRSGVRVIIIIITSSSSSSRRQRSVLVHVSSVGLIDVHAAAESRLILILQPHQDKSAACAQQSTSIAGWQALVGM